MKEQHRLLYFTKNIPVIARRLEQVVYEESTSVQDYMDSFTLKRKICYGIVKPSYYDIEFDYWREIPPIDNSNSSLLELVLLFVLVWRIVTRKKSYII